MKERSWNKEKVLAKTNGDLKVAGFRPIADAVFEVHGNFTTCMVMGYYYTGSSGTTRQTIYGLGPSKRNLKDEENPDIGKHYAFSRAVESYVARMRELGVTYIRRRKTATSDQVNDDAAAAAAADLGIPPVAPEIAEIETELTDTTPAESHLVLAETT